MCVLNLLPLQSTITLVVDAITFSSHNKYVKIKVLGILANLSLCIIFATPQVHV